MDQTLLELRWDLTDDFTRDRAVEYRDLDEPLPLQRPFRPWDRQNPLPEVAHIHGEWLRSTDAHRFAFDVKFAERHAREAAPVRYVLSGIFLVAAVLSLLFPKQLGGWAAGVFVILALGASQLIGGMLKFFQRFLGRSALKHVAPARRRSLDLEWADIDTSIRKLALAAVDVRRRHDGTTPEKRGRDAPLTVLPREAVIESIYHDPRNPVSEPRRIAWIVNYMTAHMTDRLDVARTSREELENMFRLLWEADHRALQAAPRIELPAEPEVEESMDQWALSFAEDFAAIKDATELTDATIASLGERWRSGGDSEQRILMQTEALRRLRDARLHEKYREKAARAAAKNKTPNT